MLKETLREMIAQLHAEGKIAAVCFCSHVPAELFEAAGICLLRIPFIEDADNAASHILPSNVCPIVKNTCDVLEDDCLEEADLVIAETSCDGKRKLFELASRKERMYFYQVAQGADRNYVNPLIKKECGYLAKELSRRFNLTITDGAIKEAGALVNAERESILALMEIQKEVPPRAFGAQIFEALEEHRALSGIRERTEANRRTRKELLSKDSPVSGNAARILLTGCPMSGVYKTVLDAVEQNGGVAVCFENCEVMKSAVRHFDTAAEDVRQALADCYQNTACAIMAPNERRFSLIRDLIDEYRVQGVIDIHMPVCHPYTVERDKMKRLCAELGVPYMSVMPDVTNADAGQLATRITAFLEMLPS